MSVAKHLRYFMVLDSVFNAARGSVYMYTQKVYRIFACLLLIYYSKFM